MKKLWLLLLLLLLLVLFYFRQDNTADTTEKQTQNVLAAPAAATQIESKKPVTEPTRPAGDTIRFSIKKTPKLLLLSGTFADREQSRRFARNLRPTYSTARLQENPALIDGGGMAMAAKILPLFKKGFIQGEIRYRDGRLTLEGTVRSQKILDRLDLLLQDAAIPLKNLARIDPNPPPVAKKRVIRPVKKQSRLASSQTRKPKTKVLAAQHISPKRPDHSKRQATVIQKRLQPKAVKTVVAKKAIPASKPTPKSLPPKTDKQRRMAAKQHIKTLLRKYHIEFLAAKGVLTPEGENTVDKLAKILAEYKDIHIEIAGHTDSDGSESFNQKLSQQRVDAVKKRLVSRGISPKRLRAKGYGESKPLVPNTSDANKQKNRRVEIHILKKIKI